MENKNINKVYGFIGKALLGCAGGIVGFFAAGTMAILPGIIVGALCGYLFEKVLLRAPA